MKNNTKRNQKRHQWLSAICFLPPISGLLLVGCMTVKHEMPAEPVKVDISMRVDVYPQAGKETTKRTVTDDEAKATRRREDRSGEIWTMKNDGVAIEGNNGYLEARIKTGWDPKYVNQLVTEENQDRRLLYEAEAQESARPVQAIEEEAGKRLRQQTYGRTGFKP